MDRMEKLRLSTDAVCCHCFRHGLFARFYEQSLYWFSVHVKPLKPMREQVKGGEGVLYGGLPISSLEKLLTEGAVAAAEATEYGWRWPYAAQIDGGAADFETFSAWREAALAAGTPPEGRSGGRDVLRELRAFNIAGSTPMQAMAAVADWQEYLRNWEGAG